MKQEDALNQYVRTTLKPSKIHGVGVFAIRDLVKGQKLYVDVRPFMFHMKYGKLKGKVFPEVHDELLAQWPRIMNGEPFVYPTTRVQAYMNHSDDPNYDAVKDEMLKDVKKGEEITEDYRKIEVDESAFSFLKA